VTWVRPPRHSRQVQISFCTLDSSSSASSVMTCAQAPQLAALATRAGAWFVVSRSGTTAKEQQAGIRYVTALSF